jgi:hypothetical protein
MSDHLIDMSYSLPHGCNKHCSAITCYYVLSLLLSPITSFYCTSLIIQFYSEVVFTIRAHFALPMVIVIRLD